MTHYHVTMTAVDGGRVSQELPGDYAGWLFPDRAQAASAAGKSAGLVRTQVGRDGHHADAITTGPRWAVTWTDHDGVAHTRVTEVVECDEEHQLTPASAGSSDT